MRFLRGRDAMCNDYEREKAAGEAIAYMEEMKHTPPFKLGVFQWLGGRIPNDLSPQPHIRISDKGVIFRLRDDRLIGSMTTWAWKSPRGAPVFNFKSEKRSFADSDRCLILATAFYEYTDPKKPKVKLKDQHRFTMTGTDWFFIAGIVKDNAFTMLTTGPGADIKPYHDRQICPLRPKEGMDWLRLTRPEAELLRPLPKGSLAVETLRKDGVEQAAD